MGASSNTTWPSLASVDGGVSAVHCYTSWKNFDISNHPELSAISLFAKP